MNNTRISNILKLKSILFIIIALVYSGSGILSVPPASANDFPQVLSFGTTGVGEGELKNPYGLDIDDVSGEIYIADTGNSKIKRFNRFGEYLNSFGNEGIGDGEFLYAQGVALDSNNNDIYVADTASHRIQKFHIDGNNYTFTLKFGSEGSGNSQFVLPRDIELDSNGNVYICDSGNNRISKFNSSGNWISNIGESASLVSPYGLDLDDTGNIYVADTYNHRIVKFAPDGTLLMQFGTYGTGAGEFTYPRDVAVDDKGNIFVADTENYRIQKFDNTGTYINSFGLFIEFLSPQKIVIDSDYKLYVIDSNTNRLQVYDITSYITNVYADPDPFSPDGDGFADTTSIHYTIPEPARITITIYDKDNNLIRDLITGAERITDENKEVWDARDNSGIPVSIGTYTFKIDAVNALNYHPPQQTGTVSVIYPTGRISGTVTDGTNPIEGAIVSDGIRSYPTDSNGDYTIINIPQGVYMVTASKHGCIDASQLISIGEGQVITGLDFSLDCTVDPGTGQISGRVTNGTAPIEGATLSIGNNTGTTDSNGDYTISNLNAGTYTIIARKYLCTEESQEVTIGSAETITGIDFVLTCPNAPDIRVSPESLTFTEGGQTSSIQSMIDSEEATLKDYEIRLRSRRFTPAQEDTRAQTDIAAVAQRSPGEKVHLLIQLEKIPTDSEKRTLKEAGIELLSYVPNYAWFAAVSAVKTTGITTLPLVRWAGLLLPVDKISPRIQNVGVSPWTRNEDGTVRLLIQFFKDVSLDKASQLITNHGGTIADRSELLNVLTVSISEGLINSLANEDIVQWIEEVPPPPVEHNDGVSEATGVNIVQAPPYNLDGFNIVVGVWDSGHVDASHDDFGTRVIYGDSGGIDAHPTHVGGTLGGDGTLSQLRGGSPNQWRGMAPGIQIISYEWTDPAAEHNIAINTYGIDISQNSWGYWIDEALYDNCYLYGDYTIIVSEYDSIVRAGFGKPLNIVFSAGNERNDEDCDIILNKGYKTIPPPGTGKNTITVGAVNSDDDSMTSFSSWGPVDDGRIKPDIVAPGCERGGEGYIHSTLPGDTYGGPDWCGTSMSAPVVSGTAALLIEQFRTIYNADPLPSTIKGLLIHTALDLEDPGPDFRTGYGRIDVRAGVDIIKDRALLEGTITLTGQVDTYTIDIPQGTTELKVTLVWDDEPGIPNSATELVNDLDLVLISPFDIQYEPWILDPNNPSAPAGTGADHINNIEQVYVSNPVPGSWTVKVTGTIVPYLTQNYSLISYHFGSAAVEYPTEKILTIYNEGVSDLVITDISNTRSWLSIDQSSLNIAAGNSAALKVTVDSTALTSGTYYDQIEIRSNDPDEALVIIPVTYEYARIDNPDISASPASKDFGSVDPGSSSTAQTFTISNTGTGDLVIGTISLTGTHASEFSMQNDNCSNQIITPSGTCTVDIVFSPASTGTKGANLSIPSNDPDTPTLELQLSGAGLDINLDGIVDNTDPGFSVIGNWRTYSVSNPNTYGPDLRYHAPGTGAERAVWDAELTHGPGTYKVMVWYLKHSVHASNAPFTVNHADGSTTVLVNQQINGGQWVTLGFYDFADNGTEDVTLTDDADGWVIADAVRFVFVDTVDGIVDNTDTGFSVIGNWGTNVNVSGFYGEDFRFHAAGDGSSIATWTAELTNRAGKYEVFIRYPISDAFAANAPYTINHADGSDTVPVDQSVKGGKWVSIGIYDFADDDTEYVSLSDNADSWVAADAVRFYFRSPGGDPDDGIVDNADTGFSAVGTWKKAISLTGFYPPNYRFHVAGDGSSIVTWDVELTDGTGYYEVFVWYPISTKLATNAPFTINTDFHTDKAP